MEFPEMTPGDQQMFALLTEAAFAFNRRQYADSLRLLNEILEKDSDHSMAIALRGECYFRMGRYEEAIEDITTGLFDDSGLFKSGYYHSLGLCYLQIGKHVQAVNCFSMSIKDTRWYYPTYAARAKSWFILHKYRECIKDTARYKKYFHGRKNKERKEDLMMPLLEGMSAFYLRKVLWSISLLKEAETNDPEESLIFYYIALLHILADDPEPAIHYLSKAIWFNQNLDKAYLFRMLLKLKNGKKTDAQADYDKINDPVTAKHAVELFNIYEKIKYTRLNKKGEMELLSTRTKIIYSLPTHVDITTCSFFKEKDMFDIPL
jgi:tetratricopeptide (TPR) repeat protein